MLGIPAIVVGVLLVGMLAACLVALWLAVAMLWRERPKKVKAPAPVDAALTALAELRQRVGEVERVARLAGFDIKRLDGDRESFADLYALCETLCGLQGHVARVLHHSDGGWDGEIWEPSSVTYKCTRCGQEWTVEAEEKE